MNKIYNYNIYTVYTVGVYSVLKLSQVLVLNKSRCHNHLFFWGGPEVEVS